VAAISSSPAGHRVTVRTCSLCEAGCGLSLTLAGDRVERIRGDEQDVLSKGFLCPKGASLGQIHDDPDRVRVPLVRGASGEFHEVSWDEAFAEADRRLRPVITRHGPDAVGVYVGNPSGHDLAAMLYHRTFHKALGSRNLFTVGTVDQLPKSLACALMFGSSMSVPVPDFDRTDHALVLGANPVVSNGSLLMAPDLRGRLRALVGRGGKLVVVDPRRTRTAREASEHHFIRPGTDAFLLAGLANVLFEEGLVQLGRLADHVAGLDDVHAFVTRFPVDAAARATGIDAEAIRTMARELAAAPRAVVYGRIGTTTQRFGSVASWLIDVLNVLTGNLDRPGGAMLARAAAGGANSADLGRGRGVRTGRWRSRVRGAPEVLGELPVAVLAEEITTPGDGQIRALVQFAGNPVLSNPDGAALDAALGSLEGMVSHDFYLNETTRHAHVILPATSPLHRPVYPLYVYPTAIRNVANYSPPVLPLPDDRPADWEILLRLVGIVRGDGPDVDVAALDDEIARAAVERRVTDEGSPVAGRDPDELLAQLHPRVGPERLLDLMLRTGPYGDAFGAVPDGLTLARLEDAPHGLDFGPLEPRIPGILRTPSGKIELAPAQLVGEADRMEAALDDVAAARTVLIGRRELRSLNSWMHNLPRLAGGRKRCTLLMHPDDARDAGLADGDIARVSSRVGSIDLPTELTEDIMPGVVSVPHGWGHEPERTRHAVASENPGVNVNLLVDRDTLDPLSGASVLNGVPVTVTKAGA
jgi:anaerobic selenocysteine-containing dehydrogenase